MDFKDLKNLGEQELKNQLLLMQEKLRVLRFKVGVNQLKQVQFIKNTRKVISRIKTLLNKTK